MGEAAGDSSLSESTDMELSESSESESESSVSSVSDGCGLAARDSVGAESDAPGVGVREGLSFSVSLTFCGLFSSSSDDSEVSKVTGREVEGELDLIAHVSLSPSPV